MSDKTVRWRNDALQQGWTMVPNVVLEANISPGAFRLWCTLADYARQDESCFPGQQGLAARLKTSARTIRTHLVELVDAGLIENVRRGLGKTNQYVLTLPCSDVGFLSERKPASDPSKEEEDAVEEDKTSSAAARPRVPNIVWDALVKVTGFEPSSRSERTDFGKTVSELRAVIPQDATAEQVERAMEARRRAFVLTYTGATFTHRVLRGKWGELGDRASSGHRPAGLPELADGETF